MAFISASLSERTKLQLPKISLAMAVLIMILPFNIPSLLGFFPLLDIIFIYYWAIYRPDTVPLWFIFLMGIILDIFYGMPLGVTSLVNMCLYLMINSQRKLLGTEPFIVLWGLVIVLALAVLSIKWVLFMAVIGENLSFKSAAIQWLLTILLYPLLHNIARGLHGIVPEGDFHA